MVKFFKNGFINVDQIYAMLFGPLSLIIFGGQALRLQMEVHDWIYQGQARGYGPKTHKRGCTSGGHYFQDLFTAKPLDIQNFLGYQMKDLDIVFPRIPHNTL